MLHGVSQITIYNSERGGERGKGYSVVPVNKKLRLCAAANRVLFDLKASYL